MFTYVGYPWIVKVRNRKVCGNYPISAETFDKIRPRILSIDEIETKFGTIRDLDAVQIHHTDGNITVLGFLVPPLFPEPFSSKCIEITVRQDTPAYTASLTPDQEERAKKTHQGSKAYIQHHITAFDRFAEALERSVLVVTFEDYIESIWNSDDNKYEKLRQMIGRGGRVMGMLGTHQNGDTSGYVQTGFDLEQTKEIMWEVLKRFRAMDAKGEIRTVDPNQIRELVFAKNDEFERYRQGGHAPTLYQNVPTAVHALDSGRITPPEGMIPVMVVLEDENKKRAFCVLDHILDIPGISDESIRFLLVRFSLLYRPGNGMAYEFFRPTVN